MEILKSISDVLNPLLLQRRRAQCRGPGSAAGAPSSLARSHGPASPPAGLMYAPWLLYKRRRRGSYRRPRSGRENEAVLSTYGGVPSYGVHGDQRNNSLSIIGSCYLFTLPCRIIDFPHSPRPHGSARARSISALWKTTLHDSTSVRPNNENSTSGTGDILYNDISQSVRILTSMAKA
jgi:hypothetical protein